MMLESVMNYVYHTRRNIDSLFVVTLIQMCKMNEKRSSTRKKFDTKVLLLLRLRHVH